MGEAYSALVNTLLAQVRDPQGTFHEPALAAELLARCQQLVNDAMRLALVETTLSTNAYQCFYHFALLPDTISVLGVKDGERDLDRLRTLEQLASIDRHWHRATGPRHECFVQLGETYVILYPAKTVAGSVTVVSTRRTPLTVSLTQDSTVLAQENMPLLTTLTRAFLHLRARKYDSLQADLQQLTLYFAARELPHAKAKVQPTAQAYAP